MGEGAAHRLRTVKTNDGQVSGDQQVARARPLEDLGGRQIVGREHPVDGGSGAGLVQGIAHHRKTLRRRRIEGHGDHARGQTRALDLGAVTGLTQIARART